MAHNVNETPTFDSVIEVPDEGDLITAFSNNANEGPVGPGMTSLANRAAYLRGRADMAQSALSVMAGRVQRPTLLATATTLSVGPFAAIVPDTGASNGYSLASTAAPTALSGAAVEGGGGFVANTWYYLYVSAGGALALSVTAPDAANRFKSTDPTKVYLGCAYCGAGPALIPMHAAAGRYAYDEPQSIATGLTATTWTAESLAARIPPTAPLAALLLTGTTMAQIGRTASIRPKGSAVTTNPVLTTMASCAINLTPNYAPGTGEWTGLIGVDSTQSVEYLVSDASLSLSIFAAGFQEP